MLGALGLLLSVHIKQLENFAGTMNFVIFPMYFLSTALYPLWKLQESGAEWVYQLARFNPFTHAVEWIRFALYGKDPGIAPWVVLGCCAVFFASPAGATTRSAASAAWPSAAEADEPPPAPPIDSPEHACRAARAARRVGARALAAPLSAAARGCWHAECASPPAPDHAVGALGGRRRHRRLAAAAGRTAGAPRSASGARREPRRCRRHAGDADPAAGRARRLHHRAAAAAGVSRAVTQKVLWDPVRDITPIIQLSGVTFGVLVPADSPMHARRPVRVRARAPGRAEHRHQRRRHHAAPGARRAVHRARPALHPRALQGHGRADAGRGVGPGRWPASTPPASGRRSTAAGCGCS